MGRVLTNSVALAYTIETSLNDSGTEWNTLEPNDISTFGAEITTTQRKPISRNRQRLKGVVTDLDSSVEFDADLTMSAFRDFIAGFCFSNAINSDVTQIVSTEAETATDTYSVLALTTEQAAKLAADTLVWVTGGVSSANNGLKVISTDANNGDTSIAVSDNLVDELADFRLSFTGNRLTTAIWDWNPGTNRATLSATGIGTQLGGIGLTPGMVAHVGSIASAGETIIVNGFENVTPNDMVGYARCVALSANNIVFDRVDIALQFDDLVTPTTPVDILFGEFFRNVATDHPDFNAQSFQFELDNPNLGDAGENKYQYSKGNFCNTVAFEIPLTDKATVTYGFIGTDTENPVDVAERKPGAATPTPPLQIKAFNTSSDVIRLRIMAEDEDGITTDFKNLTLTINNNVSPEKVVGVLGARFLNFGDFNVDIEAQLVFTNSAVINKIRCNETVAMDFILRNEDGTIAVDIPSMTMSGGNTEYPTDESVLINTTSMAFRDPDTNTSIGFSTFPVPLPTTEACPQG